MALPRLSVPLTAGLEVGYAANETTTLTTLGTSNSSLGCVLVLPQSSRPIWLEGFAAIDVTTAPAASGTGVVTLSAVDDQGSPVTVGADIKAFESGSGSAGYCGAFFRCRIAPDTPSRTYTLMVNRGGDTTFRAQILNGAISAAFRSYLAAHYA
jgi:hypothetical protein